MPVGMTLPSRGITLRFPPPLAPIHGSSSHPPLPGGNDEENASGEAAEETYQLLELPAEILKRIDTLSKAGKDNSLPLTIKGRPSDDAVLCTPDSTFLLRTINISNSLLVCRTPESSQPSSTASSASSSGSTNNPTQTLQVRDICHQVLECVPIAPNLERVRTVLRDSAWKGLNAASDPDGQYSGGGKKRKRREGHAGTGKKEGKKWTREQLESVVQASGVELDIGLKERNVVEVDGRMLYLPLAPLRDLLTIILSLLTIHAEPSSADTTADPITPSRPILQALQNDYDVSPSLARAVLDLFGEIVLPSSGTDVDSGEEAKWKVDIKKVVAEIGKGILHSTSTSLDSRSGKRFEGGKIKLDEFMDLWKGEVGEEWDRWVEIELLEGEYLLSPAPPTSSLISSSPILTPFPRSALPLQPAIRFTDLFLTRPKWRPEEMAPFLKGLTRDGDTKERDKLVAKFVRVVKEREGTWWYPRRT